MYSELDQNKCARGFAVYCATENAKPAIVIPPQPLRGRAVLPSSVGRNGESEFIHFLYYGVVLHPSPIVPIQVPGQRLPFVATNNKVDPVEPALIREDVGRAGALLANCIICLNFLFEIHAQLGCGLV